MKITSVLTTNSRSYHGATRKVLKLKIVGLREVLTAAIGVGLPNLGIENTTLDKVGRS